MSSRTPSLAEFLLPVESVSPASKFGKEKFVYVDITSVDREARAIRNPQVIAGIEAPSRARQRLVPDDVIVSTVRPNLNTVAPITAEYGDAIASTGFCVLRANRAKLNPRYLFHWISSEPVVRRLVQQATGATYPAVSDRIIKSLSFDPPSPPVQQRIAIILDKVNSLRRKRQEAMGLADELLRSVFVDMFGSLDKKADPLTRLDDVIDIDAPMVDPTIDKFADLPHVGPDRIEKVTGLLYECLTAREEGLISKKFLFDESYVLYSKIRPQLRKCALPGFSGLCSADMYPVRPKDRRTTREFIWGLLLSDRFNRYVITLPDRANIPKLNRSELNSFEFNLPSPRLQEQYSRIVQATLSVKARHLEFLESASALPAAFGFFA